MREDFYYFEQGFAIGAAIVCLVLLSITLLSGVPERSERIDKIRKDEAIPLSEYNGQKFHERVIDAFYAASKVTGDQEKQIAAMEQRINELQGRVTILESKFTN